MIPASLVTRSRLAGALLLGAAALTTAPARAQDHVTLSEVVPALEGSELGQLELGPAPPPGGSRVVRRSEVLSALRAAGRETRGLAIPRVTRVRREARELDAEALAELSRSAVAEAVAPCTLNELSFRGGTRLPVGELEIEANDRLPRRSGRALVVVAFRASAREVRIPAQTRIECPPPAVQPGRRVRIVARYGAVEASAPGVARQPGRVGEVIRVQSLHSQANLRARVLDADTVEVLP